jgi:predicted transcriptional regulator
MGVEWLLYAFAALLVPLYMRVRRDKVLENFLRGRIYEYVRQHPGAHFRMIISGVKLSIGAVRYHLEVLERTGMIKSERKLNMKRFYTTEVDEDEGKRSQPLQRLVLSVLRKQSDLSIFRRHSGLSVDAIADTLNESHQVVMCHLRELCGKETVMPRKTHAGVRYYYMKAKG